MNLIKLYIICVLYNGYIKEITSLDNFLRLRDSYNVEIIILDNSTINYMSMNEASAAKEYCGLITYMPNNGNIGLSRSYNKALSLIDDEEYWFMTSDDDTLFSYEYLENAMQYILHGNEKVISGVVYSDNGEVLSPVAKMSVFNKPKNFITKADVYKNIYCINSGLYIHSSIIKSIGFYPETIFLDMLDFWLMEALRKYKMNIIRIVEGSIIQKFSGNNQDDIEKIITRNDIYRKDMKTFCDIYHKHILLGKLLVLKRKIKVLMMKWSRIKL